MEVDEFQEVSFLHAALSALIPFPQKNKTHPSRQLRAMGDTWTAKVKLILPWKHSQKMSNWKQFSGMWSPQSSASSSKPDHAQWRPEMGGWVPWVSSWFFLLYKPQKAEEDKRGEKCENSQVKTPPPETSRKWRSEHTQGCGKDINRLETYSGSTWTRETDRGDR